MTTPMRLCPDASRDKERRTHDRPRRTHLHDRLIDLLKPLDADVLVHSSEPRDPWANYLRCLDYVGDASHLVVVQDDAVPSPGFADAALKIASAQPNSLVAVTSPRR